PPEEVPPPPPVIPGAPPTEEYSRLWRFSPFKYKYPQAGKTGSTDRGDISGEDLNISVLDFKKKPDGSWLARIKTEGSTRWYAEGDAFEQYNLQKIDAEGGCVTIFAEQKQQMRQVCKQ